MVKRETNIYESSGAAVYTAAPYIILSWAGTIIDDHNHKILLPEGPLRVIKFSFHGFCFFF